MNKYTFVNIIKLTVLLVVIGYAGMVGYWLGHPRVTQSSTTPAYSEQVRLQLVETIPPIESDLQAAEAVCDESRLVSSGELEEACGEALDAISADYQCTSYAPEAKCVAVRVIYTDINPSTVYQSNYNSVKVQ